MKNGDKPAYPTEGISDDNGKFLGAQTSNTTGVFGGLTKRERFAMAAMQALLSSIPTQKELQGDARYDGDNFMTVVALNSIEFADALLKQLES